MDEPQSSSNGRGITFACIRFKNQKAGEYNIVPIETVKERVNKILKSFEPKHDNDFVRDKFYYVFRECVTRSTEDSEEADQDLYYKAHVLYLGESETAVKNRIVKKRVRFPNKKYCDNNSSSTEIEGMSKSSLQRSQLNQKKLKERTQKRKTKKADEELQIFYSQRQVDNRNKVVDSDSDSVEQVLTEPEGSKRQKTTEYKTTNTNEEHDPERNNNLHSEGHEVQLSGNMSPREVAHDKEAHRIVRPLSFERTSNVENIVSSHLEHLTNKVTPRRLKKRQVTKEGISTELHGLKRFDTVNGKWYLGLDVFVGKDIWAGMMAQKPTTFIRDMAIIIWGEADLLNRCFDVTKVSVSFAGRSPRKEFEADKLQLLRELLAHYLKKHNYCIDEKTRYERNLNNVLARFVQDTRKPYKDIIKKSLVF